VATKEEYASIKELMAVANMQEKLLGRVAVDANTENTIGRWPVLTSLKRTIPFSELELVAGYLSYSELINKLNQLPRGIRIKWHGNGTRSIVGSDSKDSSGESLSHENGFRLSNPHYRRLKRLADVIIAIVGIVLWPVWLFLIKKPVAFLRNAFQVLLAQKSWMGYAQEEPH